MQEENQICRSNSQNLHESRRNFLKQTTAVAALAVASPVIVKAAENDERIAGLFEKIPIQIEVNGLEHKMDI
jgi:xanthine dehydrogenase YagT iron-sulfur-binding subunit